MPLGAFSAVLGAVESDPVWPLRRAREALLVGVGPADVAGRYAEAIYDRLGAPVHVLGHSTGGSITLQLITDHPRHRPALTTAGT